MKICNFYLLRHGKVDAEPALNGHTDVSVASAMQENICSAISAQGIAFNHIISSPLRRCADLAHRIKELNPKVMLTLEKQLQEISFGELDGKTFTSIKDSWPLLDAFWQDPARNTLPQAETLSDFQQRVNTTWSKLCNSDNENTLIITHAGVIRMILADALQLNYKNPAWHSNLAIGNASLTHIQICKAEQTFISVKSIATNIL